MPVGAIVLGYTIALVFAIPPSVILTETIRRGARGGFWPAVAVQYGSIVADCVYAIVGLTGAAILVTNPLIQVLLGAIGIVFMAYLGVTGIRAVRASGGDDEAEPAEATSPGAVGRVGAALSARGPFLAGLGLGLANPWAVAFWLGVGGTFAAAGLGAASAADYAAFLVAYVAGLSTYSITVAAVVGLGHRRLERRWLRIAEGVAAGALLLFAAIFAVRVADLALSLAG
jgi:chemosensory pili system protein ChpE